jgi:hypothetical protein
MSPSLIPSKDFRLGSELVLLLLDSGTSDVLLDVAFMGVMDSPPNTLELADVRLGDAVSGMEGRRSCSETCPAAGAGAGSVVVMGVMPASPLPKDGLCEISADWGILRVLDV